MISEFIFMEDDATKDEKSHYVDLKIEVRELMKDRFKRKTLSKTLLDLRKDVTGSSQDRLFSLYQDLSLHMESYKKLKSWRWEVISQGIQELTQMQVTDAYVFITKFINDKRGTIRKQAEIAVVTLRPEGLEYFLDTTKNKISEWQQLKLLEVVRNRTDYQPPNFKTWLTSKNKYVVLFALRLINYYDQNDANTSIIELVKHRNDQIKHEAIQCIKAFHLVSALDTLKTVFWKCSVDCKIAILDTLGTLGSEKDIAFMQLIEKKEVSFSVRNKAHSAINMISPESILPTEGIVNADNIKIPADIKISNIEVMKAERSIEDVRESETDVEEVVGEMEATNAIATGPKEEELVIPLQEEELDLLPQEEEMDMLEPEQERESLIGPMEQKYFNTDFLPIVKEDVTENAIAKKIQEATANDLSLLDISVVFEEVIVTLEDIGPQDPAVIADITEPELYVLNFIPLVVEDTLSSSESTAECKTEVPKELKKDIEELEVSFEVVMEKEPSGSTALQDDILDLNVVYLEVVERPVSAAIPDKSKEIDVLSLLVGNEKKEESMLPSILELEVNAEEVTATESKSLLDIAVIYETISGEDHIDGQQLPDWILDQISDPEGDIDAKVEMKGLEWESKSESMYNEVKALIRLMPAPIYYEHEIEETMQLLDDIELFGDEREIPLLQELLVKEDHQGNKARIREIMERFSVQWMNHLSNEDTTSNQVKSPKSNTKTTAGVTMRNEPESETLKTLKNKIQYSVFEELCRTYDTESKLILLDEIVEVGDEKELYFLEQLTQDKDDLLRIKAENVLASLRKRLSDSNAPVNIDQKIPDGIEDVVESVPLIDETDLPPTRDASLFNICFDVELPEDPEGAVTPVGPTNEDPIPIAPTTQKPSILERFHRFKNKIIARGNG
tara:strand:+ start:1760 stop:4471 length:2712 start_codon:yes stop_codon:yes gene_type:complete